MRAWILLSLISPMLLAASSLVQSPTEKLLEKTIRMDWPEASKVQVENLTSKKSIPQGATLMNLYPRPALGAVSFEVSWQDKEGPQRTFGTAIVKVYQPIAIASQNLKPQDELDENKIRFEDREVSKYSKNGFFSHWEELEGKIAKTFVNAGSALHRIQVETPAEIRQGQMVDLIFESSQMVISARMKALEHGRLGSWIRVENPNSKRVIRARVSAPGQVAIR